MRANARTLAGIAVLSALVVVFDYTFKYSNLKLPFPWYPVLKFDFTGIPIVLSLLLFGVAAGTITSTVASLAILARSGDVIGSSMKGLAEFSTVLGMIIGMKLLAKYRTIGSIAFGITARVFVMFLATTALIYSGIMAISAAYVDLPLIAALLIAAFNIVQGAIGIIGGYSLYEAVRRRVPSLVRKEQTEQQPET